MKDLFVLSAYTTKFNLPALLVPPAMAMGMAVVFVFGSPTMGWIFLAAMVLDYITGVMSSIKRCIPITSSRTRNMFFKWIAYMSVLSISALLEYVLDASWIHGAAYGWIILSEGISILENCQVVLDRRIPFLGRLKKMIDAMKGGPDEDCTTPN